MSHCHWLVCPVPTCTKSLLFPLPLCGKARNREGARKKEKEKGGKNDSEYKPTGRSQARQEDHLQVGVFHKKDRIRSQSPVIAEAILGNESAQSKRKMSLMSCRRHSRVPEAPVPWSPHRPAPLGCCLAGVHREPSRPGTSILARHQVSTPTAANGQLSKFCGSCCKG